MNSPKLNLVKLWEVHPISKTEIVDENGFRTGEFTITYSAPKIVRLTLYPNMGTIVQRIFGMDYSCDKIAVSPYLNFQIDALLFRTEPVNNYATTYDYRLDKKQSVLHTNYYGLTGRT